MLWANYKMYKEVVGYLPGFFSTFFTLMYFLVVFVNGYYLIILNKYRKDLVEENLNASGALDE